MALWIALLGVGFVLTHFGMSHTPVRQGLIDRIGLRPYQGLYSLVASVFWVPQVWLWWTHRYEGPLLWGSLPGWGSNAVELVAVVGFFLIGGGIARPSPSSLLAGQPDGRLEVRGFVAFTRHPVMMGTTLLTLTHLAASGWAGDVAFWGTLFITAFFGVLHQDRRKIATLPNFADLAARTTFLPMLRPADLGKIGVLSWLGGLGGIVAAVGLRYAHTWF